MLGAVGGADIAAAHRSFAMFDSRVTMTAHPYRSGKPGGSIDFVTPADGRNVGASAPVIWSGGPILQRYKRPKAREFVAFVALAMTPRARGESSSDVK